MPIVAQDWRGVVIELDNNETAALLNAQADCGLHAAVMKSTD